MLPIGWKLEEAKKAFFDRDHVVKAMSEATYKALSKAGAFIRQTARGLIRKASKPGQVSLAGRPPLGHGAELLKKNIFFGFDEGRQSAVVGPIRLNGRKGIQVPNVLEFGGTATIEPNPRRRQFAARRVSIAARPYMQPSLMKNLPKLTEVYADSVKP